MVRESWVDAVFGTLAQDKLSLGGRESEVSVNSRASGGRSAVVFYPCPGDQIPTNQQLDEGKDEGECPPPPRSTGQLPATERTGTPVFSQRLELETVPVLPLLVNVHILLSFTRAEIQAFNDLWQRETGLHLTT